MPKRVRKVVWAKLGLLVFGLVLGLALAEFSLRIVEKVKTRDRAAFSERYLVPDSRLDHRIAPNAPGHDANGFRNATVPTHAEIVALGDSQTWGINAGLAEAWPQALGSMTGSTVYNVGLGGYGPVQYWALTGKALGFSPKVIIVGLYFGNDLYDAYHMAYGNDSYTELRAANAPASLFQDTIGPRAQALWDEEKNSQQNFGGRDISTLGLWLRGHTAVGRLLDRTGFWPSRTDAWYEIGKRWAEAHPDHGVVYDDGHVRTIMTTAYRLYSLDTDDPRISEGLRITLEMLRRIKAEADGKGARVLVLLIPTKELVFSSAAGLRGGALEQNYARLVRMETGARASVIAECKSAGIEYADALPALANAVEQGEQVYPPSTESHPNAKGYAVIASALKKKLEELNL